MNAAPSIGLAAVCTYTSPADPGILATLRKLVRNWLTCTVDIDPRRAYDIVLAIGEALSNCIEHAYRDHPAAVHMTLKVSYDSANTVLKVCVSDQGRWIEPDPAAHNANRGRGMMLMNALADVCTVDAQTHGTTVCLDFHNCPSVTGAIAQAS